MAYDQIVQSNQFISEPGTNLKKKKNWRVSFVVEYIYIYYKTFWLHQCNQDREN